jgi:beta-glucosidase
MVDSVRTEEQYVAYKDASLPIEERLQDLLARMSLEEKVRQMDQYHGVNNFVDKKFPGSGTAMARDGKLLMDKVASIIGDLGVGCIHDLYPPTADITNQLQKYAMEKTRLGIPFLFSEEGLHGLCSPGATIFPQAITLGASWNPEMARRVGRAIASEARAFGLHETFSPVLDLCRDPRWGRMEENYGEDTYLSSRLGVAMVKGLQGDNLSADDAIIAEPKHFAAYGTPRAGLNCGSCHVGERDLRMYYLPIFEAAVVEGGAMGMMCSYNSLNGEPCAGSKWLLTEVLREEWGFQGFVRSDLGAVRRLHTDHYVAESGEDAIRQAVEAGLDIQYYDYDRDFYQQSLIELVESGRLSETAVDRAVSSILRAKFMLGLFENPYTDPSLVAARVRCPKHQEVALQVAREGLCLMKNEGNLLPLSKDVRRVAVLGPSADIPRLGDYTAMVDGFSPVTVLEGIRQIVSEDTEVLFAKGAEIVLGDLKPIHRKYLSPPDNNGQGLLAEYYDNPDLAGPPTEVRIDSNICFNWILTTPAEGVGPEPFSVRWTGRLIPDHTFEGFLGTASTDSMRLWIDGVLFVDGWDQGSAVNSALKNAFRFKAGRVYDIRVEFKKDHSAAQVVLGWNDQQASIKDAVKLAKKADVAIVCLGDSSETCGEGRDRAFLDLPGDQLDLLKAVHATGTPTVLVLQIGRAATLTWEAEHIPAILNAWFGGERGGQAIAETLFGAYNPAGRLPVTFPKCVGQIPLYYNALPFGPQQYTDMNREPLFSFGHGLSYTSFAYSKLRFSAEAIRPDGHITVSVDVTNTGERAGDEVVQLYVRDKVSSIVRPLQELKGFQRVHLTPAQTQRVVFELGFDHLKLLNQQMEWVVEPGAFEVMVGGGSDAIALRGVFEVIG